MLEPMPTSTQESFSYLLDRSELLRIREMKLMTSDRDYLFFALQLDYPSKMNPTIEVDSFCDRWELSDGDFYKALGELRKKGILVSIATRLDLQFQGS